MLPIRIPQFVIVWLPRIHPPENQDLILTLGLRSYGRGASSPKPTREGVAAGHPQRQAHRRTPTKRNRDLSYATTGAIRRVDSSRGDEVLLTGTRCVEITGHSGSGSADHHGLWRAIPSEPVAPLAQRRRVGEATTIRLGPRRVGFTREELPRSGRQTHSTR